MGKKRIAKRRVLRWEEGFWPINGIRSYEIAFPPFRIEVIYDEDKGAYRVEVLEGEGMETRGMLSFHPTVHNAKQRIAEFLRPRLKYSYSRVLNA